jgi:ubiquinol-cytochrome c reductase cytochrome b subunit
MIGVTLFGLALLEGFCGYSLPDDLLSGTGLRTAQDIMLSIPVVGSYFQFFVFGGQYPGHEIIPRLYVFHILLLAGGQDVLSYVFHVPFELLTHWLRAGVFVVPFVVYHATKRACLGLQAAGRRRLLEGRVTAQVRRTPGGGYEEARTLLSGEEAYRILVRDEPRPRAHGTEVWRWFRRHRIRNALSRWFFGERVELPATEWQRQRIEIARAGPKEAEESSES